jgi:hypothetical protein
LATLLALSPALASANEGVKVGAKLETRAKIEHNDDNRGTDAERADHACFKAFGHFIAKGFIKNKGEVEVDWKNCFVPFGIAKKMNRGTTTASTTVDVTAPIISAIKTFVGSTTARILWYTNERASSTVSYRPANATTSASVSGSTSADARLHTAVLNGLTASTTYNFTISATDRSGNSTASAESSFTTK